MPAKKSNQGKENASLKKFGFHTYIRHALKRVFPDLRLSGSAVHFVNRLVQDLLHELCRVGVVMMQAERQHTLSARDIQLAVYALFTGELSKHAVSSGTKAITLFTTYFPKTKEEKKTNAQKAGLLFPPSRVLHHLRKCVPEYKFGVRISFNTGVYLAGVLEYITDEILELAGQEVQESNGKNISETAIHKVLKTDEEIARTLCRLRHQDL